MVVVPSLGLISFLSQINFYIEKMGWLGFGTTNIDGMGKVGSTVDGPCYIE